MNKMLRPLKHLVAILVCGMGLVVAIDASAQPVVKMGGNASYLHTQNTAILAVDRIDNLSIAQGISTNLRLELWAFPTPFLGINQVGYEHAGHLMASFNLGPLAFGYYFSSVNSGNVPFSPPPPGTWYVSMLLTEYNGGTFNASGYLPTDFQNLPPETFSLGVKTTQSLPYSTPAVGLWWNPAESGTGYTIDYMSGTMVVSVYSYRPNGEPQWYLAVGPLDGNTFTAALDKYTAGQCIGCTYSGRPSPGGSDGTITINFTSPTTAIVNLPGGRVTQIQRALF